MIKCRIILFKIKAEIGSGWEDYEFYEQDNRFEFTGSEDESHNCLVRVAGKKGKG